MALGGATGRSSATLLTFYDEVDADIDGLADCDFEANPLLVECFQVEVDLAVLAKDGPETGVTILDDEVMDRVGIYGSTAFYEVRKTGEREREF